MKFKFTDFRTWKRENLKMLAAQSTDEVVKQRLKTGYPNLKWKFDGYGEWGAFSRHFNGTYLYIIYCCEDGTFNVWESDDQLLKKDKKPKCFATLNEAKQYCEMLECL